MRRWIGWLFVLVGLPAALLLLFGFLGPELALADSASHFRLHLSALLLALAVVLLVCRWWIAAGAFLSLAVAGAVSTAALTGVLTPATAMPNGVTLRVFSFNMQSPNSDPDAVLAAIEIADPDIVVLQEVWGDNEAVIAALEGLYQTVTDRRRCGDVAILARPRLRPTGVSGCEPALGVAWAQIATGAGALSVMTVHLHWPAPYRQPSDLDALERRLADVPRPVLAAGDFNAAPWSHAVARVAAYTDTVVAPGIRPSWLWDRLPPVLAPWIGLPIDHVLIPPGAAAESIGVLGPAGSDHRPLLADIALP